MNQIIMEIVFDLYIFERKKEIRK